MPNVWTFAAGGVTVTLDVPARIEVWESKSQSLDFTAAGQPSAFDQALSTYRARLSFRDLDSAAKAGLAAFFHNGPADTPSGVNGVMETFTLTDHAGGAVTARFAEPLLKFQAAGLSSRWDVEVELVTSSLLGL